MTRGYASIGLHLPKDKANIGATIRAAMCYGAASVAISGERIDARHIKAATNTVAGERHIPIFRGDLRALIPWRATPVAVDLVDDALPLPEFVHPESAFYVFGPEDGTLGKAVLDWCPRRVMIPTRLCMNLAATVNVVLYDRMAKRGQSLRSAAMNAVTTPAFAHKLPPKEPTLLQLALAAIYARKAQRDHLLAMPDSEIAEKRQDKLDGEQFDTAAAFFAALERETGIDRELFEKLGDVA